MIYINDSPLIKKLKKMFAGMYATWFNRGKGSYAGGSIIKK